MSNRTLPVSGRISDFRLPALLQFFRRERKTGVLTLQRNDLNKSIYLEDGDIIFATSLYPDDRLGETLLKEGKISFKQYEISVDLLKKTGKKQGTILVEQGFISPKELFEGVILQATEIILSLFTWIDGEYEFKEGPLPSEEVVTLHISTANLIFSGISRIKDWNRLMGELPSPDRLVRVADDPNNLFQKIELSPSMHAVIQLANGKKTLYDILVASPIPSLECARILYFLLSVEMLETDLPAGAEPLSSNEPEPSVQNQEIPTASQNQGESIEAPASQEIKPGLKEEPDVLEEALFETEKKREGNREKIEEAYRLLENQNHYEALHVLRTSSREEIKKAYFMLAKEYHPDRHFESGMEEIKGELHTLFARITEAYDTLVTDRKRKDYDTRLSAGKEGKKEPVMVHTAHEFFVRGEFALKQGDLRNASYFFEEAIQKMPEKTEKAIYYLRYGQTIARIPGKLREAEEVLKKAIALDSMGVEPYLELGTIYTKTGLRQKAIAVFSEVLKKDPNNSVAKAEIQKLQI
jgi:curved DNA-binding protein CbpA